MKPNKKMKKIEKKVRQSGLFGSLLSKRDHLGIGNSERGAFRVLERQSAHGRRSVDEERVEIKRIVDARDRGARCLFLDRV